MTIALIDTLACLALASVLAIPGVRRLAPLKYVEAAPNPANAIDRVTRFEPDFTAMEQRMNDFVPKRPAATLDDMMADIDDTETDLSNAIGLVERLIERKRTQIAALRTRLDAEDAKLDQDAAEIAARKADIVKIRTALPAAETAEETQP